MKKKNTAQSGMTLVEIIVGGAILILAAVLLSSGFLSVLRIQQKANLLQQFGTAGAGVLDLAAGGGQITAESQPGYLLYFDGGVEHRIQGSISYAADEGAEVIFSDFTPDGLNAIYPDGAGEAETPEEAPEEAP